MNVNQYLHRINCIQPVFTPSLSILKVLQKNHLLNVPFENLDIHSKNPIHLNVKKIYNKVVLNRRGGFCYELNSLFNELLVEIGFNTKLVSGRVYDKNKGYGQEFDHLAVVVNINEKEYLVDVGFGEFMFGPLEISLDKKQVDERGIFFIDNYKDDYLRINLVENDNVIPQYIFKPVARSLSEFQEMCNYHQSSDESHFTQKRLISIPTSNGRITITGNSLKIKEGSLSTEKEINEDEFKQLLTTHFKLKGHIM